MAEAIQERARELERMEDRRDEVAQAVKQYVTSVAETAEHLGRSVDTVGGGEFGVLWIGLETDYGLVINRSRVFTSRYER